MAAWILLFFNLGTTAVLIMRALRAVAASGPWSQGFIQSIWGWLALCMSWIVIVVIMPTWPESSAVISSLDQFSLVLNEMLPDEMILNEIWHGLNQIMPADLRFLCRGFEASPYGTQLVCPHHVEVDGFNSLFWRGALAAMLSDIVRKQ